MKVKLVFVLGHNYIYIHFIAVSIIKLGSKMHKASKCLYLYWLRSASLIFGFWLEEYRDVDFKLAPVDSGNEDNPK